MIALNPVRTVYCQIAEQIKFHYPKLSNITVQKQTLDLLNDVALN
jgi:ABC-type microcin C transport system duplicated ATPase subunit YejF